MATEIVVFTFARLHAVVAVVSFRAYFRTLRASPSGLAPAHPVVSSAFSLIKALAMLATVHSESSRFAWRCAVLSDPAWQALTFPCNVVAIASVLARAFLVTILSKVTDRARMFASQS